MSVFNWWSQIIIPAISAALFLIVAIASLFVAVQSHKINKFNFDLTEKAWKDGSSVKSQQARIEIADLIIQWWLLRWSPKAIEPLSREDRDADALLNRVIFRLGELGDDSSHKLASYLQSRREKSFDLSESTQAYVSGAVTAEITSILILWPRIPECGEIIEKIGEKSIKEIVEDGNKRFSKSSFEGKDGESGK